MAQSESSRTSSSWSYNSFTWSCKSKISCLICLFSAKRASTSQFSSSMFNSSITRLLTQVKLKIRAEKFTYELAWDSFAGSWYRFRSTRRISEVISGFCSRYCLKALYGSAVDALVSGRYSELLYTSTIDSNLLLFISINYRVTMERIITF